MNTERNANVFRADGNTSNDDDCSIKTKRMASGMRERNHFTQRASAAGATTATKHYVYSKKKLPCANNCALRCAHDLHHASAS